MSTSRINYTPKLPKFFSGLEDLRERTFFLLDVGASGGIEVHWQAFADRLTAIGFEPLVEEVKRLNRKNKNRNVRYVDGFVTHGSSEKSFSEESGNNKVVSKDNTSLHRASSIKAQRIMQMNYEKEVYNRGLPVVLSQRSFSLDDYTEGENIAFVDFIKIDTDGHDYQVLRGAKETLKKCSVLGISIEAQFHGAAHDEANVFSNIDRFLRDQGFTLFDLDIYRYTRAALPGRFTYDIPAQTHNGQVQWGEAVFFRDLSDPDYSRMFDFGITYEKIVKLACLFEIFGQDDSAAELLVAHRELLQSHFAVNDWLDALTPSPFTYQEYLNRFDNDPRSFFRSADKKSSEGRVSHWSRFQDLINRFFSEFQTPSK